MALSTAVSPSDTATAPARMTGGDALADMLIPDLIPLADEIGLALLTLLFGLWKDRKRSSPRSPERPAR